MTRVVFMGTPEFAVPSLGALLRAGYDVVAVYTREDQPAGRGQRLEASPVKRYALAQGLPLKQPGSLRAPDEQSELSELAPDLLIVAAYGLILPQAVLDIPPMGCINVHGSLLPRHRGASPAAAAILAGDREAGVSIMLMDAGVDTGPVLGMRYIPVSSEDTTGSLTTKLADLGAELLVRTLPPWLRGAIVPQAQPEEGATFAPRIAKEDGRIDWTESAEAIARKVRAYQPWPSAFTTWNGQSLKVFKAHAAMESAGAPGAIIAGGRRAAGVATGDGILWLEEVQIAGKKVMPIGAFLAGAQGFVGSTLG